MLRQVIRFIFAGVVEQKPYPIAMAVIKVPTKSRLNIPQKQMYSCISADVENQVTFLFVMTVIRLNRECGVSVLLFDKLTDDLLSLDGHHHWIDILPCCFQ